MKPKVMRYHELDDLCIFRDIRTNRTYTRISVGVCVDVHGHDYIPALRDRVSPIARLKACRV